MDKTNLSLFLKELHLIEDQYSRKEKEREQFNIFSVLLKQDDEVNLHSMFIASLLNPYGSHKSGELFLRKFLEKCDYQPEFIEKLLENAHVSVTPNEYNRSETRNMDILVINESTRHAFFLENKIGANDSNHEDRGQLEGYYETLLKDYHIPDENIELVFLSMYGREPSDESYGTRHPEIQTKCKVYTYNQLIIPWLEECLHDCIDKPFLRETILQYIKLIKNMTNDISIDERKEILKLIGKSEDNIKAAKLLVENYKHIKWHTLTDFWNELSDKLIDEGCILCEDLNPDDVTYITHFEDYKKGYTGKDLYTTYECKSGMEFYIYYSYDDALCFCVENSKKNKPFSEALKTLLNTDENYGSDKTTILFKYFNVPEEEEIYFSDFTYPGTFNLVNPEYRNKIVNKLVKEIKKVFSSVNVWK